MWVYEISPAIVKKRFILSLYLINDQGNLWREAYSKDIWDVSAIQKINR